MSLILVLVVKRPSAVRRTRPRPHAGGLQVVAADAAVVADHARERVRRVAAVGAEDPAALSADVPDSEDVANALVAQVAPVDVVDIVVAQDGERAVLGDVAHAVEALERACHGVHGPVGEVPAVPVSLLRHRLRSRAAREERARLRGDRVGGHGLVGVGV
ncbi:hypothetical protein T492DRAFT_1055609 [Pavlovales sp. CCMP2436]|nr:hypothetical protein T492DRAFT_1055609 [Pavlovales sp. CCMP2436]